MKNLFTILFLLPLFIKAQIPTANAGSNITIYLSSTSTATLAGSATNRSTSTWTEISTDYMSGATITSPGSLTTTVTGLPQGVFYFELDVVSATDIHAEDTVAVIVDLSPAPATATLLRAMETQLPNMVPVVNDRHDTTSFIATQTDLTFPEGLGTMFFDRSRLPCEKVDTFLGKFISRIDDGYGWNGNNYARSEIHYGSTYGLDSNKIYMFEWKGYFPQDFSYLASNSNATAIMQIHGNDGFSPPFEFVINSVNGLTFFESSQGGNGSDANVQVATLASLVNQTHTIRLTLREGKGYPGQDAFVKVEVDGVQKYYRNTGTVGSTIQHDWPKYATLYDYNRAIVDPSNSTRHREFSLVTEKFDLSTLTDTVANVAPTAHAGSDQTITLPTSSVTLSGSGTDTDGTIASYSWTKTAGGTATITSPTSASTTITGLLQGSYTFQLTVTDNNGATDTDTVNVTVNGAITNTIVTHGARKKFVNK